MKKHMKKKIVMGLGSMLMLEMASADILPLNLTSYAKENEKIFSNIEWNSIKEEVEVEENIKTNTIYTADENILSGERKGDFEIDENGVLTKYYGNSGDVVIPKGVTTIGRSAFRSCRSLTSVTIPEGVTTIGGVCF